MSRRILAVVTAMLLTVFLVPLAGGAQENEGECPPGYAKISTGFSGLSWTADADYQAVILVGGPPGAENQDPDGRDKTFFNVEEGDILSRVAHDISHICVLAVTTTTAEETTLPEETTIPTVPTTLETTTTLVEVNPICIDCNNATQADLMQLTGVDAPLALAIIANRPYFTLQDLVTKGVMTQGQLLLILVANVNTGAFVGPSCLSVDGTTSTAPEVTTTTTGAAELPLTGVNGAELAVGGGSLLVLGLMLLQAVRKRGEH